MNAIAENRLKFNYENTDKTLKELKADIVRYEGCKGNNHPNVIARIKKLKKALEYIETKTK